MANQGAFGDAFILDATVSDGFSAHRIHGAAIYGNIM